MKDSVLQEKIGFKPHKSQQEILKSEAKNIVICAGRRFGKSSLCAYIALKTLLDGDFKGKPVKIWIVSPTYDLSQKVFTYLVQWFIKVAPSQSKAVSYRPFPQIKTARGSLVQCKSAENPAGLLGEELDLLIIDECSRIKRDVYEAYLYPTTVSRSNCRRFFISTPFGKNWFYEEWIRAKPDGAFQFTSMDGVSVGEKEWENAKKRLPTDVFEQEFMAAFNEKAAAVFRGVREIIADTLKEPERGHRYYLGLDSAKFRDFTVLTVVDRNTHNVVAHDRFHRIPYTLQKERIATLAKKYANARVVAELNNIGVALADDLKAMGLMIDDFKTVGTISKDPLKKGSKERLIEKLATFIEERNIKIPPIDTLVDELEAYSYEITDSGNMKYGPPTGLHDDCVMSLALAAWNLSGKKRTEIQQIKRSTPHKRKKFQYY